MDKKNFPFFESYYKSFMGLSPDIIGEIILAMGAFYFDDADINLDGVPGAVYALIEPILENSKHISEVRSKAAKGNGAPKGNKNTSKNNQEESKEQTKTNKNQTNEEQKQTDKEKDKEKGDKEKKTPTESKKRSMSEIVKERNLDPRLEEKVLEWLKYKTERREGYKETGLNSLITEIQNNVDEHGLDPVLNCMTTCMGRGYKGIIFELIEKGHGDNRASPKGTKFTNFEERNYHEIDDLEKRLARN